MICGRTGATYVAGRATASRRGRPHMLNSCWCPLSARDLGLSGRFKTGSLTLLLPALWIVTGVTRRYRIRMDCVTALHTEPEVLLCSTAVHTSLPRSSQTTDGLWSASFLEDSWPALNSSRMKCQRVHDVTALLNYGIRQLVEMQSLNLLWMRFATTLMCRLSSGGLPRGKSELYIPLGCCVTAVWSTLRDCRKSPSSCTTSHCVTHLESALMNVHAVRVEDSTLLF